MDFGRWSLVNTVCVWGRFDRNYTSVDHIGIEHAVLFEVVRNGVLGEQGCLQSDFGADPLAFGVRLAERMFAGTAGAELWTEGGFLDWVEVLEICPGFVADCAGDVDAKSNGGHRVILAGRGHRRGDEKSLTTKDTKEITKAYAKRQSAIHHTANQW